MMIRKKQRVFSAIMVVMLVMVSLLTDARPVKAGNVITVTTTKDEIVTNSACSLREAVIAANENRSVGGCPAGGSGTDTIIIPKNPSASQVYQLTLTGEAEDGAKKGDLDIIDSVVITGAGMSQTTISTSSANSDRIFHLVKMGTTKLVRIQNMTITGGGGGSSVQHGGGIYNERSRLVLDSVKVSYSKSSLAGGGISSTGYGSYLPSLTINNAIIESNESVSGGGIFSEGSLVIERSLIWKNKASGGGGGIDNNAQPGTYGAITNSTLTANSSPSGAGIVVPGPLKIYNSTIYGNSGMGLLVQTLGSLELKNTIIGGHAPNCGVAASFLSERLDPDGVTIATVIPIVTKGNNLVDDTSCSLNAGLGDIYPNPGPVNLGLSPLANNGGPTMTFALAAGSDARDAGTNNGCPASDQRMFSRPVNGVCDIGAFEADGQILKLFMPAVRR